MNVKASVLLAEIGFSWVSGLMKVLNKASGIAWLSHLYSINILITNAFSSITSLAQKFGQSAHSHVLIKKEKVSIFNFLDYSFLVNSFWTNVPFNNSNLLLIKIMI